MTFDQTTLPEWTTLSDAIDAFGQAAYTAGRNDQQSDDAAAMVALQQKLTDALNPPVFTEDWSSGLNAAWQAFNGAGSYATEGARVTSNVEVVNGAAGEPIRYARVWARPVVADTTVGGHSLKAGVDWAAGGFYPLAAAGNGKFGPGHRWTVLLRFGKGAGVGGACMLWGDDTGSVHWPASNELDFHEIHGGVPDRSLTHLTYHYANSGGAKAQKEIPTGGLAGDWSTFHTFEVAWPKDSSYIAVSADGIEVARWVAPTYPIFTTGLAGLRIQTSLDDGGQSATTASGVQRQPMSIDVGPVKVYTL